MNCKEPGCGRAFYAKGLCSTHYHRELHRKLNGTTEPYILRSDNLRSVPVDDTVLGWFRGIFEKLPRKVREE